MPKIFEIEKYSSHQNKLIDRKIIIDELHEGGIFNFRAIKHNNRESNVNHYFAELGFPFFK